MGFSIKQVDGGLQVSDSTYDLGSTPLSTVKVKNEQFGPFIKTTLTLNNVAQTVTNGTEYQGTKIYDFPAGRLLVLGVTATLQQKTTSAIASTINSGVTGAISLGTATASSVTLAGTMVDLLPSTAFTSSTTINVAGAAVSAALAASAHFDGTSTAKDMYLNTAYATTTDVDGDGTQTISGTVVVVWVNLGDY
jgi:hypothetical protein